MTSFFTLWKSFIYYILNFLSLFSSTDQSQCWSRQGHSSAWQRRCVSLHYFLIRPCTVNFLLWIKLNKNYISFRSSWRFIEIGCTQLSNIVCIYVCMLIVLFPLVISVNTWSTHSSTPQMDGQIFFAIKQVINMKTEIIVPLFQIVYKSWFCVSLLRMIPFWNCLARCVFPKESPSVDFRVSTNLTSDAPCVSKRVIAPFTDMILEHMCQEMVICA